MALPIGPRILVLGVGAALMGGVVVMSQDARTYDARVVLDSATNVVVGGPVLVNGFEAGKVQSVEVENGKAVIDFSLDREFAPLHDGAEVVVAWKAVLSERQLSITDGPKGNEEIPDGGTIPGTMPKPTEVDDLLNALDEPTRRELAGFVANLSSSLEGNEKDARGSLQAAGPALQQLGQLLQALGTDGPAIRNLARRMNDMMSVVDARGDRVQDIVSHLAVLTDALAEQDDALDGTLTRLPGTLRQATATLNDVPGAVDQAEPLLADLGPATEALGPVAKNLRPVLQALRPASRDLRLTVAELSRLLGVSPALLDDLHGVLPDVESILGQAEEPVGFMRPYTPEMTAFFSTWGSSFSNYDSNGNFARIFFQQGPTSLVENPGIMPPGVTEDSYPAPGGIVDQPWLDADGSGIR